MEKLVGAEKLMSLECLGLCEHCGTPLSFENMPWDGANVEWWCSSCEGVLTNQTFAYEEIEGEWKKTRWVGPEAQWVDEQPDKDFTIGNWRVVVSPSPRAPFF